MLSLRKVMIALLVLGFAAIGVLVYLRYAVNSPTSDDYEVYAAFMKGLSAHRGWQIGDIHLASATSTLSVPQSEAWVPAALQIRTPAELVAPYSLVEFCGEFCGREFIRKNLSPWELKPAATGHVRFISSTDLNTPNTRLVTVTRIGFDVWHRRAVLEYSVDCSESDREIPIICAESGDVFLQKTDRGWEVKELTAINM